MGTQKVGRLLFKVLLVFHSLSPHHIWGTSKKDSPGIHPELNCCQDPRPLFSVTEEELGNMLAKYSNVIEMWKNAKMF